MTTIRQPPRDFADLIRACLRPHRVAFFGTCAASIANKILDLMPPLLTGWVIDALLGNPPRWAAAIAGPDLHRQAVLLAALGVAIFGFESLFQWMYQSGFMRIAQQVQHSIRMLAYRRLQNRELEFFENHRLGETMTLLNDDINQLERFLNSGFNEFLQLATLFVFTLVVLFGTDVPMALIGCAPIPFVIWGSVYYQRKISPRYRDLRAAVGALNSRLENNIAGIAVIKSFTAETFEARRVEASSQAYRDANFAAIRLNALYTPAIRMLIALGFGGVLLAGGWRVIAGQSTVGELALFTMLIQRLLWPLTRLGATLDEYERAHACGRRTLELLNSQPKVADPASPVEAPPPRGEIEFDQVGFSYANGLPVLNGVSLRIQPGETVGFAGATGAGKSTLIKLLLRFYDPVRGVVRVDGADISQMSQRDLRRRMALVSQDVYLFHGTIAENIAYGLDPDEPDLAERIKRAAEMARLHDFVQSLPEGYVSIIGERGIKLSGGQRQRLSIARAILKNAAILIFDEATSSVDTETERAIQENLAGLTRGRTALIIAHRLSTIRHADRIIGLRDGAIVEEGRHEDLLRQGGVYADLWRVQSGEAGQPAE